MSCDSGLAVLIGGFCYFLIMGGYYTWASINIYACSYLMNVGDSSASVESLFLVIPLNQMIITLTMPLGSYISQTYSPKLMIFLGSIIISSGNLLASYMKSSISFVFFFAVFFGIGNGLSYMASLQCVWKYYPNSKGTAGGIILSAIGVGSFIFSQLSSHMINPANLEPTLQVKTGRVNSFYYKADIVRNFPHTLRVLAGIQLVLGLIATFLVRNPGKARHLSHNLDQFDEQTSFLPVKFSRSYQYSTLGAIFQYKKEPTLREALTSRIFWHLYILLFLLVFFGLFVVSVAKPYGLMKNENDHFNTSVISTATIIEGSCRFLWSSLVDRFGFKPICFVFTVVQILVSVSLASISKIPVLYFLWVILSLLCAGAMFAIFPPLCSDVFGPLLGGQVYSFLFSAVGLTTIIGFILSKFFITKTGFQLFFYISTVASLIGLLFLLLLRQERIDFFIQVERAVEQEQQMDLFPERRLSVINYSYRLTAPFPKFNRRKTLSPRGASQQLKDYQRADTDTVRSL